MGSLSFAGGSLGQEPGQTEPECCSAEAILCKGTCGTRRALGAGTSPCHLLTPCLQPGRQDMTPWDN